MKKFKVEFKGFTPDQLAGYESWANSEWFAIDDLFEAEDGIDAIELARDYLVERVESSFVAEKSSEVNVFEIFDRETEELHEHVVFRATEVKED